MVAPYTENELAEPKFQFINYPSFKDILIHKSSKNYFFAKY